MPPIVQSVIIDIETQFEKRVFEESKLAIDNLDKSIIKLKEDSLKLSQADPQFAKLTKEIGQLTQERNKLQSALEKGENATAMASKGFGNLSNAAGLLKGALAGVGLAIGGLQLINFVRNSVAAAAQLEKTAKAFEVFGLSAAKAKKLTEDLDNLAAKVPFEGDQILEVSKNLLKFNISADELTDVVQRLAVIASGAGFSFDALSDAYGRANATGKVFGRDFLQLYKNIPGLAEQIAANTGKTIDQVVKLGKAGKLSFKDFNDGIKAVTEGTGKYADSLTKYQESFAGVSKQFSESVGDTFEEVGKELLPLIAQGLQGFGKFLKEITPALKVFGEIIGSTFLVVGKIAESLTKLPGKVSEFYNAAKEGRVKLGGRFLTIEEKETDQALIEIQKLNERFIDGFKKDIEKRISPAKNDVADKISTELTEEQIKALNDLKANYKKFILELQKTNEDVAIQISGQDEFEKAFANLEIGLKRRLKSISEEIEKFRRGGIKLSADDVKLLETNKQNLTEQFRQQVAKLIADFDKEIFKIEPVLTLSPKELQIPKENIQKLVEDLNKSIQVQKADEPSFFEKLFEVSEDEQKKITDQLDLFSNKATEAANTFIESQLARTEFLISESESRLNQLLSIQEGGNASQVALEQRRLDKLNEQRRKHLEQQRALDAAQILANNAITASESIKTIATAFGRSGNPLVGIAASLALVATIASTIVSVNAQLNSIPKFWEGAEEVGKKLRPNFAGRDGHLVRVDGGERVIPTSLNKSIPKFVKNTDLPGLVTLGLINQQVLNDRNITNEQKETNRLLRENQKLLKNNTIRLQLINSDSERLRLQRMAK